MTNEPRRRKWVTLALLAAAGYVLLVLYDRPRGATGAWLTRAGLTPREAELGGRRVRFVRAGSGTPLVLVHGFASSIFTWSEVLPALARRHDVVALDLPGFGASEMPAGLVWSDLPETVLALMDHLGLERATLAGHSLGGAVVTSVAARAPRRVERLVLLDSAGFNLEPSERPRIINLVGSPVLGGLAQYVPVRRLLLGVGLRQVFDDDTLVDSERVEEYLAPLARRAWLPAMRSLLRTRQAELRVFPELLGQVRAPALIVWGRADAWTPVAHAQRFHERLPASRVVILEACGHMPQEERPRETLEAVESFLDAAPPGEFPEAGPPAVPASD